MGYMIVLRGHAGSGKDTIGKCLVEKLGGSNKAYLLNLDITGPLEEQFIECLQKSLRYNHVIGMLFWGDTHTENPDSWITNFKNKNYTAISIILDASLQTLIRRVEERGYNYKPPEEMRQHFEKFRQIRNIFAIKAGVKEISIHTERKSSDNVAEEILSILSKPPT
jgi:deoxyadenosine/deoxycytidine kinase